MTEKEIQELALKFLKGQTTKEEEILLHSWYEGKGDNNERVVIKTDKEIGDDVRDRLFRNIKSEIQRVPELRNINKLRLRRTIYYAASIFLIISFTSLYFYLKEESPGKTYYTQLLKDDVGPGGNNAILELGDGTRINLDQASIGDLAEKNGLTVSKLKDGVLSLSITDNNRINSQGMKFDQMNTIQTPKGGQYHIKLPDGTDVWLNASSTIRFPSVFMSGSREVELEGEAYFEVAHIQDKENNTVSFIVKSREQKIEVLGTHFNVNSYSDEGTVKTTLLEGSVRIVAVNSHNSQLLKPGQRALVQKGDINIGVADIESDIAWKKGDFVFNSESLHSVMRKIERWYDVEVEYQNVSTDLKFSGAVSRSKNLSEVLKIMELTGKVEFKIDGRRIIVMT